MSTDSHAHSAAQLDVETIKAGLLAAELSGELVYLPSCPSTFDLVLDIDLTSQPQGWAAAVTDEQTAGRGRLDRSWDSPMGAGVLLSVVSEPPALAHAPRLGVLPLAVGAAVTSALRDYGVPATVKWPNDIVVSQQQGWGKLGGLLLQVSPMALMFGVGLNYSVAPSLPADHRGQLPTTLLAQGLDPAVTREQLVVDVIGAVVEVRDRFVAGQTDALLDEYRQLCATLGAEVMVSLPSGDSLTGIAEEIAADGRLVVRTDAGMRTSIDSADVLVVHPRPG
jgi:BirA family transcriptional regulator, biotin operon repressor / biotin---[acetyl-CoA-carboxylase] ligase